VYSSPERDQRSQTLTACSRFENKYIIHPMLLPAMRQFLLTVARVDPYTRPGESHEYSVCSLYLDTEDLLFYKQTRNGDRTRFKLRARTYSDAPDAPVFLEVKARVNRVITKRRVCLSRSEAEAVLAQEVRWWDVSRPNEQAGHLEHFVTQMALTSCRPLVRVRYLREAYIGLDPEPVRVTFDTRLQYKPTFGPTLLHNGGGWLPVGIDGVILEIKFTGAAPAWVEHLVCGFGLQQVSCCKFARAVSRMLRGGLWEEERATGCRLPAPLVA
jgi:hypothetical protein